MRTRFNLYTFLSALIASVFGFFGNAFATPTVADLWTAVDTATLGTQVITILTAFVGIRLAFLVYKYVKRTMGAA